MDIQFDRTESLKRPAWTLNELWDAHKHKYTVNKGKPVIIIDYYVKSQGNR